MTAAGLEAPSRDSGMVTALSRAVALSLAAVTLVFVFNNYLTYWQGWPGVGQLLGHLGWLGAVAPQAALDGSAVLLGWIQLATYVLPVAAAVVFSLQTPARPLAVDAALLMAVSAYVVRTAFWSVFLIGIIDGVISFLRVEELLPVLLGETLAKDLGISSFRGTYVHLPVVIVAAVMSCFMRTLGFIWLSLLVVAAEFQIVIARFIFSYEQAFMGDLVRFWYAALFLFASAYTLIEEGHVRVDVLFASFSKRTKALVNALGSILLGVPLCWTILAVGMSSRAAVINSPLLSFETTQSGFGLYVKYLMAGFLAVYAVSMMIQFLAYFLSNLATLYGEDQE